MPHYCFNKEKDELMLLESVDHLLLHCLVANRLWRVVLNWFRVHWVIPNTVKEALHTWAYRRGKRSPRAWNVTPLAVMWLFGERNRRAFEGVEQDIAN